MSPAGWSALTRLGEAQILLPLMLGVAAWMARRPAGRAGACVWLLATAVAAVLTTVSKVAFIGYEVGYAPWDFTGISGHTMFACAILPVVLRVACDTGRPALQCAAVAAGVLLALAVGVSRYEVGAHSVSEIVLGVALGLPAVAVALRFIGRSTEGPSAPPRWGAVAVVAWLLTTGVVAPPSRTHDAVTRLSMALSQRAAPYTRAQMHQAWRKAQRHSNTSAAASSGAAASLGATSGWSTPAGSGQWMPMAASSKRIERSQSLA